jgi:hypothetical protein
MNSLMIKYRWIDVQSAVGYNYRYPDALSAHMRRNYCRPSIYKWYAWLPTRGFSAIYVGETDNLVRRVRHCLAPGKSQVTNLRLKAYFDEALKKGERVELQILDFEPFQINNLKFSMDRLGHTHVRQLLENFIVGTLQNDNEGELPIILNRVLTKDRERQKKQIDLAMSALSKLGLTPDQTKQLIDAVKTKKAAANSPGS